MCSRALGPHGPGAFANLKSLSPLPTAVLDAGGGSSGQGVGMGVPQPLVAPKCCKDSPANGEPLCMQSGMKKWALEGSPERAPGWKTWSAELISELQAQPEKWGSDPHVPPCNPPIHEVPGPTKALALNSAYVAFSLPPSQRAQGRSHPFLQSSTLSAPPAQAWGET